MNYSQDTHIHTYTRIIRKDTLQIYAKSKRKNMAHWPIAVHRNTVRQPQFFDAPLADGLP